MSRHIDAQTVAKRALCLASFVLRAQTEYELRQENGNLPTRNSPVLKNFVSNQVALMKSDGLWEAASAHERALLQKPPGTWTTQEVLDGQWREEDLLVLMWALQPETKLAPYDQPVSERDVMSWISRLGDAKAFLAKAKLRDSQQIANARDGAELWLWRARTTQLQNENFKPKGQTFEDIIGTAAAAAEKDGFFTAIDHDFPAFGRSYAKLSQAEWHTMYSISIERLYALNWLCEYSEDWDNVPTDT